MSSSLGLVGDLDDVDLIEDIEAAFGLRLPDDEIERCCTVGQLFGLIEARLPEATAGGCATAMTFYRLRRALQAEIAAPLRPTTSIRELGGMSVRKLHRIIRQSGLRPPPEQLSLWGGAALVLVAVLPTGALLLGLGWLVAAVSAITPYALFRAAPIRLPHRVQSFGDLVRVVASRSIGALSKQGARLRLSEAWDAFTEVLSDHTPLAKQAITLDTLILAPKKLPS